MSLNQRLAAARELVAAFRRWPDDSGKIYKSFRNSQIALYETSKPGDLPTAEVLHARAKAADILVKQVNAKKFKPSQRFIEPNGQPDYYNMIQREASGKSQRVDLFTAARNSLYGWWK